MMRFLSQPSVQSFASNLNREEESTGFSKALSMPTKWSSLLGLLLWSDRSLLLTQSVSGEVFFFHRCPRSIAGLVYGFGSQGRKGGVGEWADGARAIKTVIATGSMRSRREAGDFEEKGHISIERTSDLDSKLVERDGQKDTPRPNEGLKRGMESRHIQMISIGGVIGTGLFLGTASALHNAGPAGMILGYLVMGSISWVVMSCLGEMVAHLPISGGHVTLAERFVSPSLSFTMGYNYWYSWSIILPTEMSASAVLINYWITSVNNSVWIFIALAVTVLIVLGIVLGKLQLYRANRVAEVINSDILNLIVDLGGGPNREFIGARHWKNPGPWVEHLGRKGPLGHFMGFLAATNQASFSTLGSEIAAFAAAEAKNPKKALPTAIRAIIWRLAVFYFLGTTVIGLLVPSNEPRLRLQSHTAASSPFVIAIEKSGIKYLPSIINLVLISSAWSAASSNMYISSRALYSLAIEGNAPKIFRKTNSWGVPWTCTIVAAFWGCLALLSVTHSGAGAVFGWLANMYSTSGFLTWIGVLVTYVRWDAGVKAQKIDRSGFPYRAPLVSNHLFTSVMVLRTFQLKSHQIILCSVMVLIITHSANGWRNVRDLRLLILSGREFLSSVSTKQLGPNHPFYRDFVTESHDDERDREDTVVGDSNQSIGRKLLGYPTLAKFTSDSIVNPDLIGFKVDLKN
ncbi:hypothetical protein PSHT_08653 [Puccinia striiformis]|uniref:Amino acid permease/ SLC12A domain-containing protein n=1 Tax=Puccinia striiformis TaxID=27350 RepID=A0A2S4VMJ9_9BASI|nr:hypothetical protein PSHT_08653 [Puccinia striiformis]